MSRTVTALAWRSWSLSGPVVLVCAAAAADLRSSSRVLGRSRGSGRIGLRRKVLLPLHGILALPGQLVLACRIVGVGCPVVAG